jgi:uncharacterized peroxidase-related enzyme
MSRPPILESNRADPDVAEVYEDFRRRMGFPAVPNFLKAQGHSLSVARGTWGLVRNVLVEGQLPRTLKEMMFVAISKDRGCRYCDAAHLACCRMLGVDAATLDTLVERLDELRPERVRALITFGVKCARDPQSLDEADFAGLVRLGLSQAEIVEAISMSALAVYANILADATGIADDEMFSQL